MPWLVVKRDDKWKVYKKGPDGKPSGDARGTFDTEEEARQQQKALYINVKESLMDGVVLLGDASFVDDREERLIRFTNATLARVETNANNDVIDDEELDNLVATLAGMPVDIEHNKKKNVGTITAARREGHEIKIDGYLWPHRIAEYDENPDAVLNGEFGLSIEADALAASCSICGKIIKVESEYCEHLKPQNKLVSGAKRAFRKLRGMGAAITRNPAGTGAGFETRNVWLVAHLVEDSIDKSGPPSAADNRNESKGGISMTLEELNAALDAKLQPIAARLEADETFRTTVEERLGKIEAATTAPPVDEDAKKKEMEAALKDVEAKVEGKYKTEAEEMKAQLEASQNAIKEKEDKLTETRTEMLRLKLVGQVMDEETFEKQKADLLATPQPVLDSLVASFQSRTKADKPVWMFAGKVENTVDDDYKFEVS